jgi:hypothetical protein
MPAFSSSVAAMDSIQTATFGTPIYHEPVTGEEAVLISAILSSADHAFVQASELTVPAANGDKIRIVATDEIFTVTNVEADAEGGVSLTIQKT